MKIYALIVGYLILFAIGGMCGWIIEFIFRRLVHKKWINPGFLTGPFIPLYGFGVVVLYAISDINIHWGWKLGLFLIVLTAIEYLAGLIFIKLMKIKLWDYSNMWGNIQGIICPLFSVMWLAVGSAFLFFLYEPFKEIFFWSEQNLNFSFFLGLFYGVLAIDFGLSVNISTRLRSIAKEAHAVLSYEKIKEYITEENKKNKQRLGRILPFHSPNLSDRVGRLVTEMKEKSGGYKLKTKGNPFIRG